MTDRLVLSVSWETAPFWSVGGSVNSLQFAESSRNRRTRERDDLTREQRREITETLSIRTVSFDLESPVSVTMKGEM
ncbi:hypothetical protein [Natrinema soli]|uniref:Uncharacterized protein n=1 Tax=Natrinema soli TaxID=1930624 RepID=A0ABD5SIE1_9EURY|nr:hypothetical protein [Natrinema soli]